MTKQQYTIHNDVFLPAHAFPQYQFGSDGPQVMFLGDVNASDGTNNVTNNIFITNSADPDSTLCAIQKDKDWLQTLDAEDAENQRQIKFMSNLLEMASLPVHRKTVDSELLNFLETNKRMQAVKPDQVLVLSGLKNYTEF